MHDSRIEILQNMRRAHNAFNMLPLQLNTETGFEVCVASKPVSFISISFFAHRCAISPAFFSLPHLLREAHY